MRFTGVSAVVTPQSNKALPLPGAFPRAPGPRGRSCAILDLSLAFVDRLPFALGEGAVAEH